MTDDKPRRPNLEPLLIAILLIPGAVIFAISDTLLEISDWYTLPLFAVTALLVWIVFRFYND